MKLESNLTAILEKINFHTLWSTPAGWMSSSVQTTWTDEGVHPAFGPLIVG